MTVDKHLLIKSHEMTQGQAHVTATYRSKHFLFWPTYSMDLLDTFLSGLKLNQHDQLPEGIKTYI